MEIEDLVNCCENMGILLSSFCQAESLVYEYNSYETARWDSLCRIIVLTKFHFF